MNRPPGRPPRSGLPSPLLSILLWLCVFAGVNLDCPAQEISVTASLEPASVAVGESAELSISIQGAQEPDQPPAVQVEGAEVRYAGPTKQATLNNFQLSVSMSHRYVVTPSRVGDLTIPAVALEVRGKRYETQPVALKVTASPEEEQQAGPMPFVECDIPRRPVYVGESFPVQVRLLVPSNTPWRIERLPTFETDAFTKSPFQQPQQQQQVRNDRPFDALLFPTALTAVKSGEVPLGPIQFKIQIAAPQKKRNDARSPFGGIFNGFPFNTQQNPMQEKTVVLPEHKMRVNELPEEGRPASFRGAIGQFQFQASFNQNRVKMGEPIVVTLTVEGQGNFDRIEAPPLISPDGWRVYPPEIQFTKSDEFGLRGIKTFRIAVVPHSPQTQMPEFEFASFHPDAGTYQVQKSQSAPLQVEGAPDKAQAEAVQNATVLPKKKPASPNPSENPKAPLIPTILEHNLPSIATSPLWANPAVFWTIQALLIGAVLAGALWQWNTRRLAALGPGPQLRKEARQLTANLPTQPSKTLWFQQARRAVQLLTAARSGKITDAVDLADALTAFQPSAQTTEELRWLFETDAALRFGGHTADNLPKPEEQQRIRKILDSLSHA